MKLRQLLASSVALLLTHAAHAESNPAGAEPITVATSVGNEQSDFFIAPYGLNVRVVFSSRVKQISKNGAVVSDQRAFFQQRIQGLTSAGVTDFFAVGKASPLKKITTLTVPTGTTFDHFLYNADGDEAAPREEFFHVPTKGIYVAKNGTSISLLHAETATAPTTPGALKDPGNAYNDSDHATQSRYVFGAKIIGKGAEPFIASSSAKDTVLLKDIETATNIGSNPHDFATFNDSVYFLTAPDAGGVTAPALWHVTVDTTNPQTPKYSAIIVAPENNLNDPHLAGGNGELFLSKIVGADTNHTLCISTDGVTFDAVNGGGMDPLDITPNIQPNLDGTGYSSLDGQNLRRFTEYSSVAGESFFTDATGDIINPYLITSTGNYFYYGAAYQDASYVIRDFTGGNGTSNLTAMDNSPDALTDENGNFLNNLHEIVFVHNPDPTDPDTSTGEIYFTADVTRNNVTSTGLLFQFDPNADNDMATTVKTNSGAEVVGAHNLRRVANGQNFRLYFCAPVSTTQNSEYLPKDSHGVTIQADFGTKPWVYAPQ